MRTPINNIIGAAQVMKDQLYGPIENRKYRQYAADIYSTGNQLLEAAENVLTESKAETDYLALEEKPVDVAAVINRTLRFMADKMQTEKLSVRVKLHEPMPRLIADEFRLQQILMNVLLYVLKHLPSGGAAIVETRVVNENKDKVFFAITVGTVEEGSQARLIALADRVMGAPYRPSRVDDLLKESTDLSLELAKVLVALHGGALDISLSAKGPMTITLLFAGNRIRFVEA
jgi:K+-sensing histidine kinase KdpD